MNKANIATKIKNIGFPVGYIFACASFSNPDTFASSLTSIFSCSKVISLVLFESVVMNALFIFSPLVNALQE